MTSKEFARLLGVSQSMVSRALSDSPMVSRENRDFIKKKALELGFELNRQAQSLRTKRTGTVGILFPEHFKSMSGNPMLAHLYDHMQREMIKNHYDVMTVYERKNDGIGSTVFERIIKQRKIDGLITLRYDLSDSEIELLRRYKFPCVTLLNSGEMREDLHYCVNDDDYAGYAAGAFLGQFADYTPLFLGVDEEMTATSKRLAGFKRGLEECGRTLGKNGVIYCKLSYASASAAIEAVLPRLKKRKTAILAHNDMIGLGALNACTQGGVPVPGQVQIIGVDDIPMASWVLPRLSTMHTDIEHMIPDTCSLLLDLIAGKKLPRVRNLYKPRLIQGGTTLPA